MGIVGGAIYIVSTVWSVFFGKPLPAGEEEKYRGQPARRPRTQALGRAPRDGQGP
jgi:hypothetical protein